MSGSAHSDVVVVGGGLVGACIAEELATHGVDVVVLDAGAEPGHATSVAAGVAVPSLRYLKDEEFYRWLVRAREELERDLARLEPRYGSFSLTRPVLRLLAEQDLRALSDTHRTAAVGSPVSAADVARLAPGLQLPQDRMPFLARDGLTVSGRRYLLAVRAAALAAGATWRQGQVVTAIEEGDAEVEIRCTDGSVLAADRVVVAAGAWTGQLVGVPVAPQRGQLVLLDAGDNAPECIVSGRLYLAPLPAGGLLAGATEEEAGFDDRCTAGSVAGVIAYALRLMPALASATVVRPRAGLRPVTSTGRPLAGRVPGRQRTYVAAGHAGHGLLSARATAQGLVAGLAYGDWTELPENFCPLGAVESAVPAQTRGRG